MCFTGLVPVKHIYYIYIGPGSGRLIPKLTDYFSKSGSFEKNQINPISSNLKLVALKTCAYRICFKKLRSKILLLVT